MMTLCGGLPFLATFLWTAAHFAVTPSTCRSWRWSLALSCVLLATFSLVLTETLSAIDLLSWRPVLAMWILYSILPAGILLANRSKLDCQSELSRVWQNLRTCPLWIGGLLGGTATLILIMAVATPPMNFDVQIYHMPRQIYWLMQGSVEPFAAAHSHQISMPVLSEFIGLNLLVLSGGDHWHNLVQSLYLLASCGIISIMAQAIGRSPRAGWLGILFAGLVPVVFFEASNAKNDILVAFFILVPALLALRAWQTESRLATGPLFLSALCAGLAIATKGTAVAYLPAAGLALAWAYLRKGAWRPMALVAIPGIFLVLLPPAPQFLRNIHTFGSPAGPNLHHTNQSHGPKDLLNVAIRNTAGQFTCDSEIWNKGLENTTRAVLAKLGCDPDDPATTFESQPFHLPYFAGLEDLVPAPAQTTLILLLPLAFLFPTFRRNSGVLLLFGIVLTSLVVFCAVFRWQPWQGRLLIPAYLLAAPLAGIFLDSLRPRWMPVLFAAWALASLRPHLIYAGQRPLFGESSILRNEKTDQMSRMHPGRSNEIRELTRYLKESRAKQILIDGGATEIYGLLRELHQSAPGIPLRSKKSQNPGSADAIIIPSLPDAGVPVPPANTTPTGPDGFEAAWIGDYYTVFYKKPSHHPAVIAASFVGYAPTTELSEIWKQGSSLKKSGRISTSPTIELKPLVQGEVEVTLEGKGPNGTVIGLEAEGKRYEQIIENGRFAIQAKRKISPESRLVITSSKEGIFWTKIRISENE